MNVILIGRGEILPATGSAILEKGHTITAIITAKESPEHRVTAADLKVWAKEINADYIYAPSLNHPDIQSKLKTLSIDIGISVNYTSIIGQEFIDLFPHGILNAHGGDLPRYKGNACQAWALLNGEDKIGLCVHKMVGEHVDEGKIIARNYLKTDINTKIGTVYQWMEQQIPLLMVEALEALIKDPEFYIVNTLTQTDIRPLRCYPRIPEDGKIDWRKTNVDILRLVNASGRPFAGAFCMFDGRQIHIIDAHIPDDNEDFLAIPGQILKLHDSGAISVACGYGKIIISTIEIDAVATNNIVGTVKSIRKRLS